MSDEKARARIYRKLFRQKNKEKIRQENREYRAKNKEKISERQKQWYQANKEKIKERKKDKMPPNNLHAWHRVSQGFYICSECFICTRPYCSGLRCQTHVDKDCTRKILHDLTEEEVLEFEKRYQ